MWTISVEESSLNMAPFWYHIKEWNASEIHLHVLKSIVILSFAFHRYWTIKYDWKSLERIIYV